jgi:ribonuclease HII
MLLKLDAIGIDEVGRGAIAGPVVAAAVWFADSITEELLSKIGVNDSKKLTAKKRDFVNKKLIELSEKDLLHYGIGIISPEKIDADGIVVATNNAMKQALHNVKKENKLIFVDGIINPFEDLKYNVETIIKGDATCYNIAAASVIAKEFRDKIMSELSHDENQCYNWMKNKGYCTSEHMHGIFENGLSKHHRKTFCKNLI